MLLTKAINKVFKITITMFIILTVFTIINTTTEKTLKTNVEVVTLKEENKDIIYLLSTDNYLVQVNVNLKDTTLENKVINIIEELKENNNANKLNGYLPKNLKVNSVIYENTNLKLNLSEEFNEVKNKDLSVTGIVYSLLELSNINTVEILVNNKFIEGYENKLDKSIGINKEYLINSRSEINKVVVYYYTEVNGQEYLTPVTKYINDNREKIEIIIEELSNNIPYNLITYLPDNILLNDFIEENEVIILNFNKTTKTKNDEINNKINSLITKSVFENYDVNMILLEENGKKIDYISKKQ